MEDIEKQVENELIYLKKYVNKQADKIKELEKENKDPLKTEEKKLDSKLNEKIEKLRKIKATEYREQKHKLELETNRNEEYLKELRENLSRIKIEIEEDEESYNLYKKIKFDRIEAEKEEQELKRQREKFKENNQYINLTEEELDKKIEESIEKLKEEESEKINKKRKELEKEYEETIFNLEKQNRANLRSEQEKYEVEKEKLEKEYNKKVNELEEKYKEAEKEKNKIIKFLGFSDFIENNDFLFRDKIEAYLILNKKVNKRKLFSFFTLNEAEFISIYRNVIMTVNELIKLYNENIDLKANLKQKKDEEE
jgi:CRE-TAG-214 protein